MTPKNVDFGGYGLYICCHCSGAAADHFWVPNRCSALPKRADNETGNNERVTDPSQISQCPKMSHMLPRCVKSATETQGLKRGRRHPGTRGQWWSVVTSGDQW